MTASDLLQQIVFGLGLGAIYGLVAMGFSLIYRTMGLLSFVHPQFVMLGSVFGYTALVTLHLELWQAAVPVGLATALASLAVDQVGLRPIRRRGGTEIAMILATVAWGIVLVEIVRQSWAYGPSALSLRSEARPPIHVLGIDIRWDTLGVLACGAALAGGLALFLRHTRAGRALRAVGESSQTAVADGHRRGAHARARRRRQRLPRRRRRFARRLPLLGGHRDRDDRGEGARRGRHRRLRQRAGRSGRRARARRLRQPGRGGRLGDVAGRDRLRPDHRHSPAPGGRDAPQARARACLRRRSPGCGAPGDRRPDRDLDGHRGRPRGPVRARADLRRHLLPLVPVDVLILGLAALGLQHMVGDAGVLNLGQAAFFGLGAYGGVWTLQHWHWSTLPAFAAAIVVGLAGAVVMAPLLRLRGVYFAMASFAFGAMMFEVFGQAVSLTGGENGLFLIPPPRIFGHTFIGNRDSYLLVLSVAVVCYAGLALAARSGYGLSLHAVRQSENGARAAGVNVARLRFFAARARRVPAALAGRALLPRCTGSCRRRSSTTTSRSR